MIFRPPKAVVISVLTVLAVLLSTAHNAFAQETRTLAGEIRLDVGVAPTDLSIDITVNNHSIAFLPVVGIIRPITSKQTRRVTVQQGQRSASYFIDDIITNPVDYTVRIECVGCSSVFRTQYYAESGNRFGFANPVFLDPQELGPNLNAAIITDVRIDGEISLENDAIAKRDLNYELVIADPANPQLVYLRRSNIVLAQGQSSVAYQVSGLRRQSSADLFSVTLLCTNCFRRSAKPQTFPEILSRMQNHQDINFTVTDEAAVVISPLINLLLE